MSLFHITIILALSIRLINKRKTSGVIYNTTVSKNFPPESSLNFPYLLTVSLRCKKYRKDFKPNSKLNMLKYFLNYKKVWRMMEK